MNCPMGHRVCTPKCSYKEVCKEVDLSDPVKQRILELEKQKDAERKTNLR